MQLLKKLLLIITWDKGKAGRYGRNFYHDIRYNSDNDIKTKTTTKNLKASQERPQKIPVPT